MIECRILDNGDLALTGASGWDREELGDVLAERGQMAALCEGLESYSCNGSFTPFDAGDGNPFVGLTSAPCIAESMSWDDDGTATIDGAFWYYGDYAVTCPVERLVAGETVIFTRA